MHYKELEVWKKSIELVKAVYKLTEKFPKEEQFGLTSQIKRAVISIPSNIAEGNMRMSNKENSRFINIAMGSLTEVETQLIIAKELGFIKDISKDEELLKKVNALLIGFRKYIIKSDTDL